MQRRAFMTLSATAAASAVFPRFAIGKSGKSTNGKLNVALIGSGGWIAKHAYDGGCKDENLVAFCDVDRNQCAENMKAWSTNQPFFEDYRVMLDKMHKEIDAVVVSTPDHSHFPATMAAMERGIHVYTQKPLAHNIWQARTLIKAKERYKVMTQMGNQGHAWSGLRVSAEAYRAGVIGDVSEVHAWNKGPAMGGTHFADPKTVPLPTAPVPEGLSWDLWLGPVASRPYSPEYLPYKWRSFYDFGLGMLGDWGCHTMDAPAWCLDLDAPTAVDCVARERSLEGVIPAGSRLDFHFAPKGKRGKVTMHWYDGPQDFTKVGRIDKFGIGACNHWDKACWMVGTKGAMGWAGYGGTPAIFPNGVRKEWQQNPPPQVLPRAVGSSFVEWINACKETGPEPGSNFNWSGKLTEIILLGVLAQRFNTRIEWDAAKGQITNKPELNAFVKEPVRAGWEYGETL